MAVKCPKCGAVQEQTTQCKFCGIDFEGKRSNPFLNDPVIAEIFRIARQVKQFYGIAKSYLLTNIDRVSAKIGVDLRTIAGSIYKTVSLWCRDVLDLLMTILVCGVIAWGIGVVLLSVAEGFWSLYLATEVGKQFLVHFPWRAGIIFRIIHYQPLSFSFTICIVALKSCLMAAVVARILFFARFLYENRPVSLKVIIWAPICAAVSSWFFYTDYDFFYQAGFFLSLIPVLFLFHPCFELAAKCLPEANLIRVYRVARRPIIKVWRKARLYLINRPPNNYL